MMKENSKNLISEILIDKESAQPLHLQIAVSLRQNIIRNRFKPGTAMPSERWLAEEFEINRNTVHRAYETLASEGLVEEKTGRNGLFIAAGAKGKYKPPFPAIGIVMPSNFSEFVVTLSQNGINYLSGIIDRATEAIHSTMILTLPDVNERTETIEHWLEDNIPRLSGIVHLGSRVQGHDLPFEMLLENKLIPQVFISGYSEKAHISSVYGDVITGGMSAAELLREYGHRKIGILAGVHEIDSSKSFFNYYAAERYRLMLDCFRKCNLDVNNEWLSFSNGTFDSIKSEIDRIMQLPECPTAFWCHNDDMALKAIRSLKELGFKVPDDVSVIGFDDIREGGTGKPALTTIKQPCYAVGRQAVNLALDIFEHGMPGSAKSIKVPTALIVRESVSAAKNVNRQR